MCIHRWARMIDNDGHTIYVCTECPQRVDFTAARDEFERQEQATSYDPTAAMIETPAGPGRFVEFDGSRQTVVVEMDFHYLVEFDASKCYVPVLTSSEEARLHA